jgi:hypothetical protein
MCCFFTASLVVKVPRMFWAVTPFRRFSQSEQNAIQCGYGCLKIKYQTFLFLSNSVVAAAQGRPKALDRPRRQPNPSTGRCGTVRYGADLRV